METGIYETAPSSNGEFLIKLSHKIEDDKIILLGEPDKTRFEYKSLSFALMLTGQGAEADLILELSLSGASIVLKASDGDGFIQKILPKDPITLDFDFTMGLSRNKGTYFDFGAGLELTIQVNKSLGPILVRTVDLIIDAKDTDLSLITSVSGDANIGPITATVEKIGLKTLLEFGKKGLLGDADFSLGFKPPSAVGLAINASGVKGGGYLEIEGGNYAGILSLDIEDKITVTVVGILTTQMPDGSKDFSLKLFGMAAFPPIQLGFGFVITGIGLAVAINCCMNEEALRAAVYAGRLTSLLFPPDPINNAKQIISDLKDFFPPKPNYYVFGAMVKLGWGGDPPLLKADVGLFLEFGDSLRIALAGIVHAELPCPDSPTIILQMQVLGILDFKAKSLSIDASLTGSKILDWPLDGGIALRSCWGDPARFAFSAGGFHPSYRPPAGFPQLARLSIALGSGNPRIGLFSYLAITENSVQFGAALIFHWQKNLGKIDLGLFTINLGLIEVDGGLSFDALFKFNPFYFEASMCAWLELKRNGDSLLSIDVRLTLSGPNNYHAVGYAKAKVCGVGVEVEFDKTFGDKKPELPQQTKSPIQALKDELENKKNWMVELPSWGANQVVFREGMDTEDFLDPLGGIAFRQKSVPLQYKLQKFGQAAIPAGQDYFDLLPAFQNATVLNAVEPFAPGEFVYLSDHDKVSAPPFEKMKAGIKVGSETIDAPTQYEEKKIAYETKYLENSKPSKIETTFVNPRTLINAQKLGGNRVHNRFGAGYPTSKSERISVHEQEFTVVDSSAKLDKFNRVQDKGCEVENLTYAQARQKQNQLANPETVILHTAKANDLKKR